MVLGVLGKSWMSRALTKVAWELAAIDKGKYAHHTLKEIHEQPNIIEKAGTQNSEKIEGFCNILMSSKTVFLTGSGTSYHSALIAKHILSKFAKIRAEAIMSSEFQYTFDVIDSTSVLIAISQSGETADVLQSARLACRLPIPSEI
jgi:glucosamine--fructose-6-phosphate aminotransferase (isomerizing)